jgi:hypothetical protein
MQMKSLYIAAAVLASFTFLGTPAGAQSSDWDKSGVSGIVSGKSGDAITAQLPGYAQSTIVVTAKTRFRRYAPDSVKSAQTAPSGLEEISAGDQIRARGVKSSDGSTITADEVISGTFLTKGGTITAIDPIAHELTIQEVGTNKPLVVRLAAQSRLKMLPDMHMPEDTGTSAHHAMPEHIPTTPSGAADLAKIIGSMPDCNLDNLKIGGAVIVSSTKGAADDKVTAITLLANAGMIVQMMQQQADGNGAGMEHFLREHGLNPVDGLNLPSILQ